MTIDKQKVVDALYGILSDPVGYEALVRELDQSYKTIVANVDHGVADDHHSAFELHLGEVEPDFNRVAQVFERFRFVASGEGANATSAGAKVPIIELGENGAILRANVIATALLGVRAGDTTDALELDCGVNLLLRRAMRRIGADGGDRSFTFLQAYTKDHSARLMLMLSPAPSPGPGRPMAILQGVDLSWRPEIGAAISNTFDLTPAELDILQGIVAGASLAEIAARKKRSLATVRTQAKALLRKTEAKSQLELVRIFSAMSLAVPEDPSSGGDCSSNRRSFMLERGDSRTLQVDVFGPDDGSPVLFVHGFVTGTAMTDSALALLDMLKLRVIAPWRPAFAGSSPLKGTVDSYLATISDDISLVMDRFGLERATLASRDSGVIYAAAAAKRLGQRTNGVVAIAGTVPTRSRHQLDHIALWQRMFAYSARYFPAALPVLARGAMEMVSAGKLDKLLDGLYETPPIDARWAHEPEVSRLLRESFEATFVQGTKGYEMDARQTATDWSSQSLDGLQVPLLYIHGKHDPISVLWQVEELVARHRGIALEVIPDGGQLIWYSHPERVLSEIRRFVDNCSG